MSELLEEGVKYIVTEIQEKARYLLHADSNEKSHAGISYKIDRNLQKIIGGGMIRIWKNKVNLSESSTTFGEEPITIRFAFVKVLNERFKDDLAKS